jgi:ABC-2 type transport system permease protein
MLAVSIINEKNRHVYELFLIRPLKRRSILFSKYLSVYLCVAIASLISVLVGIVTDFIIGGTLSTAVFNGLGQSLAISLSVIAVACAAGVLIGVASPSVLVGAILVIYGGNQTSVIPLLPTILNLPDAALFTIALAVATAAALLAGAVVLFERKQF